MHAPAVERQLLVLELLHQPGGILLVGGFVGPAAKRDDVHVQGGHVGEDDAGGCGLGGSSTGLQTGGECVCSPGECRCNSRESAHGQVDRRTAAAITAFAGMENGRREVQNTISQGGS